MSVSPAILEALAISELPDVQWLHGDDLCDCTFQRIGMWKNRYTATQQEIRLCCIWARLGEMFPEYVRTIPAYFDENKQAWDTTVHEWDGEDDMPKALWHRHLARKLDISIGEARSLNLAPPRGSGPRVKVPFVLLHGGNEIVIDLPRMELMG